MDDKELRRRMKKRKNKRKNVIKLIIALIFLCIIAAIAGFFIKVSIDNKYIFLCKVVTDSDSIVAYREDNDDFDVANDTLVLIKGFKNPTNKGYVITKNAGLASGTIGGKYLEEIDKILIEDFYKYFNIYVDEKNKFYLSDDAGNGIVISDKGIAKTTIDKKLTLRAERVCLFDNNVELVGLNLFTTSGKNSSGENVEIKTYAKPNEEIVGIDVNKGETYLLEEILMSNNRINNSTTIEGDKYDTTIVSGRIGYVYIKIGSSSYSVEKDFQIIDNVLYTSYAEVCDKYKIPYGFYYYSTAITEEEADKEYDAIVKRLDSLTTKKYNVLPLTIDVELADNLKMDRQYGKNVTGVKAYLANKLYEKYGKTVLYTSGKTASTLSENKILDLVEYRNATKEKALNVWLPTARLMSGEMGKVTKTYYEDILSQSDTLFQQTHLDLSDKNGFDYDIDIMSKTVFNKLVK
jgi:hypothetical protein